MKHSWGIFYEYIPIVKEKLSFRRIFNGQKTLQGINKKIESFFGKFEPSVPTMQPDYTDLILFIVSFFPEIRWMTTCGRTFFLYIHPLKVCLKYIFTQL